MKQANKTTDGALRSVDGDAIQAATSQPNRREGMMRVNQKGAVKVPKHADGPMWLIGRTIMCFAVGHGKATISINRPRPLISCEEYEAEKERIRKSSIEELGRFLDLILRRGWLKPIRDPALRTDDRGKGINKNDEKTRFARGG